MKTIYYSGLILLVAVSWSCRDVYYPDDIDSSARIPVVQGIITAGEIPRVTLTWARNYEDNVLEPIIGAEVYVSDDKGNLEALTETNPGNYSSLGDIIGVIGNTYTLRVVLPDGNEFLSKPQLLMQPPMIDSLYASPGTRDGVTYSSSKKPIITRQLGLHVSADLSGQGNKNLYFRFNTRVVKEMVYTADIGSPASHSVYLWETKYLDNSYSVDNTLPSDGGQLLPAHSIGFLWYYYDATLETETSTAPFTEGWILTFKVYNISQDVFGYYNSIGSQLNSDDQIFAPVASQVKSNLHCVNDPVQKVAGVFEASSYSVVYKAFGWNGLEDHYFKDLDWFPEDVGYGRQERFPPYFWVLLI